MPGKFINRAGRRKWQPYNISSLPVLINQNFRAKEP